MMRKNGSMALFPVLLVLYGLGSSSLYLVSGQIATGLPCDQNALGMGNTWIRDADVTASSLLDIHHDPGRARLHGNGAWMPAGDDVSPVLQIYLEDKTNVSAIAVQGHPVLDYWVTNYSLAFSLDGQTWHDSSEVYTGNVNNHDTSRTVFPEPKVVKALRIKVLKWHGYVAMRTEIYGCPKGALPRCGIHSHRNQHSRQRRVVGGKPAQRHSWPWQVEILNGTSMKHGCGGALIHPQYIITAGHCVDEYSPVNKVIVLGEHDRGRLEGYEEVFSPRAIFIHPGYIRGDTISPGDYDISIVRLDKPVMLYDRVGPICLPDEGSTYRAGDECFVTGWGRQHENGSTYAEVLNEVQVPLVSRDTCNKNTSYGGAINEQFLCAGYPAGGKDACYGDSGGPLACQDQAGRWVLTGSVSWGVGCAQPNNYGVYADIHRLLPFIESVIYGHPTCGMRFLPAQHSRQKRVVGGKVARPNSWPWLVELLINGTHHYCGGSLVGPSWVVTAAHCFWMYKTPEYWEVRVGEHNSTEDEGYEERIGVEAIHLHPGFILGSSDDAGDYDIALVKLKRPAVFHKRVHSACLPGEDRRPETGKACFVVGWGKQNENSSVYSEVPMEVEVPLVSHEECNSNASYGGKVNRHFLCAGYPQGGIDACYGDSGGPLVCENEENVFTLTGLVSWGDGCARPGKYGVYSDVQRLLPFIQSTMQGHPKCGVRYLSPQNSRVVGGSEARVNSWPWQVDLLVNGGTTHYCGGSLISPSWVVTSAHCFWTYSTPEAWQVRVGEHNETRDDGYEEDIKAEKIFIHPEFVIGTINSTGDFDIALIQLSRPAVFHDRVHSLCLPDEHANLTAGQKCHVTGWGATGESAPPSKVLKEAAVNLVSTQECNATYGGIINDRFICAGIPSGGVDLCYGDNGGPLACQGGDGRFFLAGIVTWSRGCARPNQPGVYLDVRKVLSFINSTIEAAT